MKVFDLIKFFENEVHNDKDFHLVATMLETWVDTHGLSKPLEEDTERILSKLTDESDILRSTFNYFVDKGDLSDLDDLVPSVDKLYAKFYTDSTDDERLTWEDYECIILDYGMLIAKEDKTVMGYLTTFEGSGFYIAFRGGDDRNEKEFIDGLLKTPANAKKIFLWATGGGLS